METENERASHLENEYPCLYRFVMLKGGMDENLQSYTDECAKK